MHKPNAKTTHYYGQDTKQTNAAVNKTNNNNNNNKKPGTSKLKLWISTVILFVGDCKVVHVSESLFLSVSGAWLELGSLHS